MSLFQCIKCGCIDNTACAGRGWVGAPSKCSACEPNSISAFVLKSGKREGRWDSKDPLWHAAFPRTYLPKGEFEQDPDTGDLRHKVTKTYDPSLERDTPYD